MRKSVRFGLHRKMRKKAKPDAKSAKTTEKKDCHTKGGKRLRKGEKRKKIGLSKQMINSNNSIF